jgi:hypothetical protein
VTATMGRPATAAPTREARVLRAARPTWRRRIPIILAAALWAVAVACAVWAVVGAFPHVVRPPRAMPTPANLGFAAFAGVLAVAVAHLHVECGVL